MKKPKPEGKIWIVVKPDAYMHNPLCATPTHRVLIQNEDELKKFDAYLTEKRSKAFGETAYGVHFWKRDKKMPEITLAQFMKEGKIHGYERMAQEQIPGF